MRLLGSLVDFEGALAGGDDPVPDYSDVFATVAPIDLGSFGDVESKLSAGRGCSLSTSMPCRCQRTIATKGSTLVCKSSDRYENFSFAKDLVVSFQAVENRVERLITELESREHPETQRFKVAVITVDLCYSMFSREYCRSTVGQTERCLSPRLEEFPGLQESVLVNSEHEE